MKRSFARQEPVVRRRGMAEGRKVPLTPLGNATDMLDGKTNFWDEVGRPTWQLVRAFLGFNAVAVEIVCCSLCSAIAPQNDNKYQGRLATK